MQVIYEAAQPGRGGRLVGFAKMGWTPAVAQVDIDSQSSALRPQGSASD